MVRLVDVATMGVPGVPKTFHFLAGLPRSGSTVLAVILNQRPDVYASPQTDLLQVMHLLESQIPGLESHRAGLRREGYANMVRSLGETFYADVDVPVVIDKNRAWGTPYNLRLARLLNPDVRILATVRPILEVLASFVIQARAHPETNFIDAAMARTDFYPAQYRPIDDARCDWLMRPNGEIDRAILSAAQARAHPGAFHLIAYDDLVSDPVETMAGVSRFLGLDPFAHDFDDLREVDVHDDEAAFGLPDLHQVRPELARRSPPPEDVLSPYVLARYGPTGGAYPW